MRLGVWSALPPASSGIADYVAQSLPELAKRADVVCRVEDVAAVDAGLSRSFAVREVSAPEDVDVDLDLYHLGNSPSQGFVWRAARRSPGVVVLHEWNLADVVRHETLGRGDAAAWRREMRLGRGTRGAFFARVVEAGLGGDFFPLCFPSNETVLRLALGIVTLNRTTAARVRNLGPRAPVLCLPLHFHEPEELPERASARRRLGVPESRFLVVAPGLATSAKRLDLAVLALARLVASGVDAELVVAGEVPTSTRLADIAQTAGVADRVRGLGRLSPDAFDSALVAADVVFSLRFPSHGETSAAAIRAMGLGACVLLTAGSETALELPRGVCVPVNPGAGEGEELTALLHSLARHPAWRAQIGLAGREHVLRHHRVKDATAKLVAFLEALAPVRAARRQREVRPPQQARCLSRGLERVEFSLVEESRFAALEVGLDPSSLSLADRVHSLFGGQM